MTQETPEILRVEDLEISVSSRGNETKLVEQVSFSLKRGETLGIVGESGSGKTLTSLSIMRLLQSPLKITRGNIFLSDANVAALDEAEMRKVRGKRISMIFQEPMTSLNPVLTIGRQLVEILHAHFPMSAQQARAKAVELLERVKIPNAAAKLNNYPFEFSGGMRQRVMIAMAMICEPELIIADEPTTALDVTIQAEVLSLLNELKTEFNTSMIFISHDLEVISDVSDRVLVMYKGRVVEEGAVSSVMKNPQHPYTEALIGARPFLILGEDAKHFNRHEHRLKDVSSIQTLPNR